MLCLSKTKEIFYFWPEEPSGCFRPNFLVVSINVDADSVIGAYFLNLAYNLGQTKKSLFIHNLGTYCIP